MIKFILITFLITLQFFGIAQPAFAGVPYGMEIESNRQGYKKQIDYIHDNSCDATAMIPYTGMVYYSCKSGTNVWSEVLVPTEHSPLFMYFKNRSKKDNEDDSDDTDTVAINSIMFN